MNATRTPVKVYEYPALKYQQRGKLSPPFVVFHAPAEDVIGWADVDRLEYNNPGHQRPLRDLKVNKLVRFLSKDTRNTIPTAVIIALDEDAVAFQGSADQDGIGEHGVISISVRSGMKPGLIIDGQHRVYGIQKYQRQMHVNVVAMVGGSDLERAFQFVVINNSATKVPKDHIKALNLQYDNEKLNKRLIDSAGVALGMSEVKYYDLQAVNSSEPFQGLLELPSNASGFVQPRAIESALAETRDRATLLGIEEFERDVFLAIWQRVKVHYGDAWAKYPKSRLLQNVSIHALTTYVLETMVAKQRMADEPIDFTNYDNLDGVVNERVLSKIPRQFWTTEWKATELDTSSGRQKVFEALEIIDANSRFGRPWYEKVSIIDPVSVKEVGAVPAKKGAKTRAANSPKPTVRKATKKAAAKSARR